MNCKKVMDQFVRMDNKSVVPLKLRLHFLLCEECRNEKNSMNSTLFSLHGEYLYTPSKSLSDNVMKMIFLSGIRYRERVSYAKWIFSGIIIALSSFAVSFSESHNWLTSYFGQSLALPINIILGLGITIYAALFIFTHLDDLKKRTHFRGH